MAQADPAQSAAPDAPLACVECGCWGRDGYKLRKELSGATDFWYQPYGCPRHWNAAAVAAGDTEPRESPDV